MIIEGVIVNGYRYAETLSHVIFLDVVITRESTDAMCDLVGFVPRIQQVLLRIQAIIFP